MRIKKNLIMIVLSICIFICIFADKIASTTIVSGIINKISATESSSSTNSIDAANKNYDSFVSENSTSYVSNHEYTPSIQTMSYNKDTFVINEPVDFSITLNESDNTTVERGYYLEVYSNRVFGDFLVASSDIKIPKDAFSGTATISITFDTPGDLYTTVKIYTEKNGTLLLEQKSTVQRSVHYVISSATELTGIDAYTPLTAANCADLKAAGISFVARYYSENESKCIDKAEAQAICNAGMQLVTVYQDDNSDISYFTYNTGYRHCNNAIQHAINIGQPATTPIYFAVDLEANSSNIGSIYNYFKGVKAAMDEYKAKDPNGTYWTIGGYGSYYVVKSLHENGYVDYTWQTASWSYDNYYNYNFYQVSHDYEIAGIVTDKNVSNPSTNNIVGGFYIK